MLMNYEEFSEELKASLEMVFCGEREVRATSIIKNNDDELDALIFARADSNIAPTLYIRQYYEMYLETHSFKKVVDAVVYVVRNAKAPRNCSIDFFKDYNLVRDYICFKLVNKQNNTRFLENAVYEELMDLAMVLFVSFSDVEESCILDENTLGGISTVTIKNEYLKMWNVTKEQLISDALRNTQSLFPPKFMKLKEVLAISYRESYKNLCESDRFTEELDISVEEMIDRIPDAPVYVLSNNKNLFGASTMIYDGVLESIAEKFESDLIIIPSSINELIIVPRDDVNPDGLDDLIAQVNAAEVDFEEVLSDHAYFYTRGEGLSTSADSEVFFKLKKCFSSETLFY